PNATMVANVVNLAATPIGSLLSGGRALCALDKSLRRLWITMQYGIVDAPHHIGAMQQLCIMYPEAGAAREHLELQTVGPYADFPLAKQGIGLHLCVRAARVSAKQYSQKGWVHGGFQGASGDKDG
ncbi:MAG: hypothetical protein AAGF14_01515, partial [Pseudomonadota bacterium]